MKKAEIQEQNTCIFLWYMIIYLLLMRHFMYVVRYMRPLGQAVKTSPFHGGNTGSIPVGVNE